MEGSSLLSLIPWDKVLTPARELRLNADTRIYQSIQSHRHQDQTIKTQKVISSVTPSLTHCGARILTSCPSAAAYAITLGPPNPWLIYIAKETLGLRRFVLFNEIAVTHPGILSSIPSTGPRGSRFSRVWNAPLPRTTSEDIAHSLLRYLI